VLPNVLTTVLLSLKAGLATYMNLAITDPLQQKGLLALDDAELAQAGPAAAAALAQQLPTTALDIPAEWISNVTLMAEDFGLLQLGDDTGSISSVLQALQDGLLYVVAVSRDCSGVC
jgi:hypothetical protein